MNFIIKILHEIPFFRHFTNEDILYLFKISRLSDVKKNQLFDLKKSNSLNIIINGIFEIEAYGKKDVVFLSQGSFFGTIPFSDNANQGTIKSVTDSTLLIFHEEDLYRLFLISYKVLRGYIKIIKKLGFNVSEAGKLYNNEESRVITVYSPHGNSGKSFFTSLMGLSISEIGKTIILDLSHEGNSIFNYFELKITSPISQKSAESKSTESLIIEKIEDVNEKLSLLNITFGAKVKVNPDILSPILFILSKMYKYILLDLSDFDNDLRDESFRISDKIFMFLNKPKEIGFYSESLDLTLKDGQRVYYMINEYVSGSLGNFEGGMILEKFNFENKANQLTQLTSFMGSESLQTIVRNITKKTSALVFETNLFESLFFTGFLNAIEKKDINFDYFYSSSYGYIITSFYLLSRDYDEFNNNVKNFFSEKRINSFLDIVFPDEHVFKKNSISKFASETCSINRIEIFKTIPIALLNNSDTDQKRIFSTGYLKNLFEASFLIKPIFESGKIGSQSFDSGYPAARVRVEDLFRMDVDEIVHVSVNNRETLKFKNEKVLNFFKKYVDLLDREQFNENINNLADKNLTLEVSENKINLNKIIKTSEEVSLKLLKEKFR